MSTVTADLAERALAVRWDGLPPGVQQAAIAVLIDAVPVMAAGATEQPARLMQRFAADFGGTGPCSVIGAGFSTTAPLAALANGVAGHVLDYEPMWHPPTHPTSPVLPVLLALAEWQGRGGADLLAALVAAFEVQTRLLLSARPGGALHRPGGRGGLHPPGVVGPLGAAVAAAKLLGLDVQRTCWALAIAGSRAGTLLANNGTMTKSSHPGNAGRMGLEAALLAEMGYTANEDILAAPQGYGDTFLGWEGQAPDLAADFGRPFRIHDPGIAIKKYPSQYGTQRAVDAALAIVRAEHPDPAAITAVTITCPRMSTIDRAAPHSGLDGKFSLQYVTAAALLDGRVVIDTFRDDRRFANDMQALLSKITLDPRPEIPPDFDGMWIRTTVKLADGRELTGECRRPTGLWGIPLTDAEREAKARDCLTRALPAHEHDRVLATLHRFAGCSADDIRALMRLLRG